MDWYTSPVGSGFGERLISGGKRWMKHAGHGGVGTPHTVCEGGRLVAKGSGMVNLDGSRGEGGGQILRTALTLSLLTGRPFQIRQIRANRDKPGLRPQHLAAVQAAAELGHAEVSGASVGSRSLTFRPGEVEPRDLTIDIGTAGATALVLQTLHLPIALKAESGVRLTLEGGTFNLSAPSFPFLAETWTRHLRDLGLTVALSMPSCGFYPIGGGRLEAWIDPGRPVAMIRDRRGPLTALRGEAGVCRLNRGIAERMIARATERLEARGIAPEIRLVEWQGKSPGTALSLTADHDEARATFVGLGERGKSAEAVADSAVDELLAYLDVADAAIDPHSADQLLLPLALAEGRSVITVSEVTEHLRTNAATLSAFLDRPIAISDSDNDQPARVVVG
jgi:RNA 3'-terminal phosphate cyclase (ATP)